MDNQAIAMPQELIGAVADDNVTRFDRAVPDAHFSLPAHPTVRQQLEYYSRYADTRSDPMYLRLWHSAQVLIGDWECSIMPDFKKANLDQITNPEVTTVIMWAGNAILMYMNDLDMLPKV